MTSPTRKIPAHGSSCSTGGILRARAAGNHFNMGDASEVWDNINMYEGDPSEPCEKGKIYLYLSDKNPANMDVSAICASYVVLVVNITRFMTIQAIFKIASQDYTAIQSMLFYF